MKHLAKNPPSTPWIRTNEPLLWLNSAGHQVINRNDGYFFDCKKNKDPHLALQLTIAGAGFYERDGKRVLLQPGMAFVDVMPGDFRYGYPMESTQDYEQVWCDMHGPTATALWDHVMSTYGHVISLGAQNPVAPLMLAIAYEHSKRLHYDRYLLSSQLYHMLMTLIATLSATRLANAPLISRAMNAIHKHGLELECNVENIAEDIGCSREHLTRVFSTATGVTPADYLMQHRLNEAARQLRGSGEKLDIIARRCGFSGANYFCRAFRKHTGLTPNEYRQRPWFTKLLNQEP
jgi:AraC-like DNA-binding protein